MSTKSDIHDALTSWFDFENNLLDAKGTNHLAANPTIAGYEVGKVGNRIKRGSRASVALASPIAISATTGKITFGGWFAYNGVNNSNYIMGLQRHLGPATQEVMTFLNSAGKFALFGWKDAGFTGYQIIDPDVRKTAYPITVRCEDSTGRVATSDQIIRISEGGTNPAGEYFVVGTWDDGVLSLFIDTVLVASAPVGAVYSSPIAYLSVGVIGYGDNDCGLDSVFLMDSHVITEAQMAWLYNGGAGRNYADFS